MPEIVMAVEIILAKLILSFKKTTPINTANMIEVSRKAVTSAIGACVNAQITMP